MATKDISQVSVSGTAVQIVAANVDRVALMVRVVGANPVFFKEDNTVTSSNGFQVAESDGIIVDPVPATDALFAISPSGATVCAWEVSN